MQTQQEDQWCWAAIAASVDTYFSPFASSPQCRIAAAVLNSGSDTCNDPQKYNNPAKLQVALKAIGRYRATHIGPLSFEDLQAEIDAGRPVCVRIAWSGGGAHFVVLSGYHVSTTGVRTVDVADPLYPDSTRLFDQFPSAYHGGGEWTATFFVNPAAAVNRAAGGRPWV
jgi:hypothetical protein